MFIEDMLDRPLVVFDLETTGADLESAKVVQFAGLKVHPEGPRDKLELIINPGEPIPNEAASVHGIYDADVKEAPRFRDVADEIAAFFQGCHIAGYNIYRFDMPVIQLEFGRCGKTFVVQGAVIDGFKIFVHYHRRTLTAALQHYCGKAHNSAHDAMGDVEATTDVLQAQLLAHEGIPKNMQELQQLCMGENVSFCGRIKREDGFDVITFGKHKGKRLVDILVIDPGYFQFIIKKDFPPDVKAIAWQYLHSSSK